jgi:hypothetical protein
MLRLFINLLAIIGVLGMLARLTPARAQSPYQCRAPNVEISSHVNWPGVVSERRGAPPWGARHCLPLLGRAVRFVRTVGSVRPAGVMKPHRSAAVPMAGARGGCSVLQDQQGARWPLLTGTVYSATGKTMRQRFEWVRQPQADAAGNRVKQRMSSVQSREGCQLTRCPSG